MNEKSKVVAEVNNEKWLWDLALLHDISHMSMLQKLLIPWLRILK
jgi:hypothetical protein